MLHWPQLGVSQGHRILHQKTSRDLPISASCSKHGRDMWVLPSPSLQAVLDVSFRECPMTT